MERQMPYTEYVLTISPTEYEKCCMAFLETFAEKERLSNFEINHNIIVPGDDGTYQIDILASFTALGAKFTVLCECKRYTMPVSREKVVVLADKVKSLGAQKGILLSTSGYQSGAVQYAKKHGIALYQLYDKYFQGYSFSNGEDKTKKEYIISNFDKCRPKFSICEWIGPNRMGKEIYPTEKMKREWYNAI